MTSLFDVDNSSDSEDCDYEPLACELSSDNEEPLPLKDSKKETKYKSLPKQKQKSSSSKTTCEILNGNKIASNSGEEKKKADDVYKNFLDEVASEMKCNKHQSMSSDISCSETNISFPIEQNCDKKNSVLSIGNTPKLLTELANQTVTENTVDSLNSDLNGCSNSKERHNTFSRLSPKPANVKRQGLDSVVRNILNKKQKMTTLTKSMLDWKNYKREAGIEEELSSYNRGKGGFLERKRFLERSDVRSFEIERDMRLSKRQPKKHS